MAMESDHGFVAWEERIISQERGNRVVHYYFKDSFGDYVLAVVGTERSIRHMIYVVTDDFLMDYGSGKFINSCTKWRARREVVEWLNSMVPRRHSSFDPSKPQENDSAPVVESLDVSMTNLTFHQTHIPDNMMQVLRKVKVHDSDIVWSGSASTCGKQLKHFPAFCRNGTTIAVHSFVFIMAEDESHYLGYLEDLYEDKKGQKKVRVRWFHHNEEVKDTIYHLNPHPREVFITPHVQAISAECIDGPATVLTPNHYEKCLAAAPHLSSIIFLCFRQFKNNKVKPFVLSKLRGYFNQAILSSIGSLLVSKHQTKRHSVDMEEEEDYDYEDHVRQGSKRNRSCRGNQSVEIGGARNSAQGSEITKCEFSYGKLKFSLARPPNQKPVEPQAPFYLTLKTNDKIEVLCQDSGIQGCWFRCTVLQASPKRLKVLYDDLEDAEEPRNLEEWIPACVKALPDKLGIRCHGRLAIRPFRFEVSTESSFEVGSAVDGWWCDGWWEGIVTDISNCGNDNLQLYFPDESRLVTLERKNVRISSDWIDNRWVDIKVKPDILDFLSAAAGQIEKVIACSNLVAASDSGGSASINAKVVAPSPNTEVAEKEKQGSPGLFSSGDLIVSGSNLIKRLNINDDSKLDGSHDFD
ncbi:Bromo adjacent homology (BAH) domain [Dillenia turbinata]|uniref:Bromo adjacent homology (BAH) domain n=1 Tax=Dillenia turbinata TaxID=194707 RepID=A0AAN8ULP6_9MAGN